MATMFDKVVVPLPEIIAYRASGERIDKWHLWSARYRPEFSFGAIEKVLQLCAPQWLHDIRTTDPEEHFTYWHSVLGKRDLPWYGSKSAGVEAYNPNLVAGQFGLTEFVGLPFFKTANRPWSGRTKMP